MSLFRHRTFDTGRLSRRRTIELGCGRKKLPGAIGVDREAYPGVDVVCDLNEGLPFQDASFEAVYSDQVLEHIPNLVRLIGEIHRILVPGGLMVARVPYFRSSWAAVDPTHIRYFSLNSLDYFVKGTYSFENYRFSEVGFSKGECYLDDDYPPSLLRSVLTRLALRWPARFENSMLSFVYPFQSLTFVLVK
jgi:SAM-dependent methyltransferase